MRLDRFRHSARCDHDGWRLSGPFLLDTPNDAVNRVHRAIKHPGPDALVCPARDHPFWRDNVRGWELRRAPEQRVGRDHYPGLDHAPEERPPRGDAVVGRGGAQIDDYRVFLVDSARSQSIRDSVRAHGERLLHVELYGKLRAGVDHYRPLAKAHLTGRGQHRCDGRYY